MRLKSPSEMDVNKSRKGVKKVFRYGNYINYYQKRNGLNSTDLRLEMLANHKDIFEGKRVLDIGCNDGFITVNVAKTFQPLSILGIDIDGDLIARARKKLQEDQDNDSLKNVIFRKANYILSDRDLLNLEKPQYDTIICLSVTKWVHLNYGDDGVKFLFKRIYKQLNVNGHFILEAQAYNTYRKRKKLTPEILENFKNIKFFPTEFKSYLMSSEVGFSEYFEIGLPGHEAKGFNRMLQVFVKK